jgi:error-prone DNA polymerase
MPFIPSWSDVDRVRAELEVLRLNVSAHPLAFARRGVRRLRCVPFARLHEVRDGTRVRLAGVLERAQMPWIRSGHRTLFLTLEDETGMAEVVVFNDGFLRYGKLLKETVYLLVEGELQNNDERGLAVVAQRIFDLMAVLRDPGILKRGSGVGRRAGAGPPKGGQPLASTHLKTRPQWGPMAPDPRYPSPSPQDHRWPKADPAEGLDDLPVVEPRTRPGRTG